MDVQPGTRLGPYEISGPLGAGGMGVVYTAVDTRLGRRVAVKRLPPDAAAIPERRRRFLQEARAASALNHPNIAQIYDVIDEPPAIVMELVDGTPLDRVIAAGALPVATALDYAVQIAGALEAAHAAGIIHRDIKPANIMIGRDGRVKVLDFGLAKLAAGAGGDATVTAAATQLGVVMGTAAYMSPEQAQGLPVDARSDVFSAAIVLYEMLAGRRPFGGETDLAALSAILSKDPPPLRSLRPDIPRDVETVLQRALEKPAARRYADGGALREALVTAAARRAEPSTWSQPSVVALMGLALVALLGYGAWQTVQARGMRWARQQAIPELERAEGSTRTMQAVQLARLAERYLPDEVARVRQSWMRFRVDTVPSGAAIEIKNYSDSSGPWQSLGTAPVTLVIPDAYYRLRLSKAGFATVEVSTDPHDATFTLTPDRGVHAGMVAVPGGSFAYGVTNAVDMAPFWIDRLEVTNRDYKRFVDAGGYRDQKYWTAPFVDGHRTLTFADAMARFRDSTGQAGPSTWELSTYPEGHADYPVEGISWFEASAYAAFAGKRLPTVYHWYKASGADEIYSDILALSNFDGKGAVRAGERDGLSPWGALDMAGNVKEWCSNATADGNRRYILGGGWNEPSYRFTESDAQSPWERGTAFGVRLVMDTDTPAAAEAPIGQVDPDPATVVPVGDAEFEFYKRFYTYDRTPLDARVTAIDDSSPDWKKETLSFAAAYGGERVPAYFFAPKNAAPPYQTIVLFPSAYSRVTSSSAHLDYAAFSFLMKSGRAVIYPVYQGTYERRGGVTAGPNGMRDMNVQWAKDFFRAVDYLGTRGDVDMTRLGYYSLSMGAYFGPIPVALEPRIKAAVFLAGGLRYNYPAEIQSANFMPRVTVPVLMINGRDDFSATPAAQQRYFDLLGTPPDRKRHVVLDGGHVPNDWRQAIREVLGWYDRYLGPVR